VAGYRESKSAALRPIARESEAQDSSARLGLSVRLHVRLYLRLSGRKAELMLIRTIIAGAEINELFLAKVYDESSRVYKVHAYTVRTSSQLYSYACASFFGSPH
jgi:hypothetical protein